MDTNLFAKQSEANSAAITPPVGEELAALEEYRATWRPYAADPDIFNIDEMRGAHIELRRWTAKGRGPAEYGIAFLCDMPANGHFRPMDVDGLQVFLCFRPEGASQDEAYEYPIGYRDEVKILGAFSMLGSSPGPDSWYAKNAKSVAAWMNQPAVDRAGMSDPMVMIEYMKANNLQETPFGWRNATHYSARVAHAYREAFRAAAGDKFQKMRAINTTIEEVGMAWFPMNIDDFIKSL